MNMLNELAKKYPNDADLGNAVREIAEKSEGFDDLEEKIFDILVENHHCFPVEAMRAYKESAKEIKELFEKIISQLFDRINTFILKS